MCGSVTDYCASKNCANCVELIENEERNIGILIPLIRNKVID